MEVELRRGRLCATTTRIRRTWLLTDAFGAAVAVVAQPAAYSHPASQSSSERARREGNRSRPRKLRAGARGMPPASTCPRTGTAARIGLCRPYAQKNGLDSQIFRTIVRWWGRRGLTPLNSLVISHLSTSLFYKKTIVANWPLSHCSDTGKPLTLRELRAYSSCRW